MSFAAIGSKFIPAAPVQIVKFRLSYIQAQKRGATSCHSFHTIRLLALP